jgi:hypothetical protein
VRRIDAAIAWAYHGCTREAKHASIAKNWEEVTSSLTVQAQKGTLNSSTGVNQEISCFLYSLSRCFMYALLPA